jgi:hypothetical protein
MGAFDCPVCGSTRHIDDNVDPECCWYCRWPVDHALRDGHATVGVTDDLRERLLLAAWATHPDGPESLSVPAKAFLARRSRAYFGEGS